jgi:hypothetical protein
VHAGNDLFEGGVIALAPGQKQGRHIVGIGWNVAILRPRHRR